MLLLKMALTPFSPYTLQLFTKKKVKESPVQAMKALVKCGCKGPHIHSHGIRKR